MIVSALTRRVCISIGVKSTYSVCAYVAIMIEPDAMSTIAVKSYFQMNFSPSIYVESSMFTMIAVAALHAKSVRSTKGRTSPWHITLRVIKMKPKTHFHEQYVLLALTLSRSMFSLLSSPLLSMISFFFSRSR